MESRKSACQYTMLNTGVYCERSVKEHIAVMNTELVAGGEVRVHLDKATKSLATLWNCLWMDCAAMDHTCRVTQSGQTTRCRGPLVTDVPLPNTWPDSVDGAAIGALVRQTQRQGKDPMWVRSGSGPSPAVRHTLPDKDGVPLARSDCRASSCVAVDPVRAASSVIK